MRCLVWTILLTVSLCTAQSLNAQCGLNTDIGPDVTICPDNLPFNLTPTLSGGSDLTFEWTPAGAVSNPTARNTTFTRQETTTLTLTVSSIDLSQNLFVNGDFEAGDDGSFTTEYEPGTGGTFGLLSLEGEYAIATNANDTHMNFGNCADHTGGGQMMVVNGATNVNEQVYCQTVNVVVGEMYALRAWVQSVVSENPARLQFSVNGMLVGGILSPPSAVCIWEQFDDRWMADVSVAEICIVNQNTAGGGNDFALDDLFFGPVCVEEDDITITVPELEITLAVNETIPCNAPASGFALDATGSSTGPDYTYQWSTNDGNIVSGATTLEPRVDEPGTYNLAVTFTSADGTVTCTEEQTIEVFDDPNIPEVMLQSLNPLTCSDTEVTITSSGSSGGSTFWSTLDGNITSPASGQNTITVDEPGTYVLTIIGTTGCQNSAEIEVTEDLTEPMVSIAPVQQITCTQSTVIIDASNSEQGSNFVASWEAMPGEIISTSPDGYLIVVGQEGTYNFTLTNTLTGCFTLVQVAVTMDNNEVNAVIQDPGPIDCDGGTLEVIGDQSDSGPGFTYEWTTMDGAFSGPTTNPNVIVSTPGTYQLEVTSPSGCTSPAFVTIVAGEFDAEITLSSPEPFTCDSAEINLLAEVNSSNPVSFSWDTPDGSIVTGENSMNPRINSSGTYFVTVTDLESGCTGTDFITVDEIDGLPTANAVDPLNLTCDRTEITLDATGSSTGPDIERIWRDEQGNQLSDLTVSEPGIYRLEIRNTATGCSARDEVMLNADTLGPVTPILAARTTLTCNNPEVTIFTDQFNDGFTFAWQGPAGSFIGSPGGPGIDVIDEGLFILTVTDPSNGCSSVDSITILNLIETPDLSLADAAELTCENPSQVLQGTLANPEGFEVAWVTDGNITAGENTVTPTINAPGNYRLVVSNPETGCADSLELDVVGNADLPPVAIAGDNLLTCTETQLELSAVNPISGDSITYTWSTTNGNIVSGEMSETADVNAAGTYFLVVENLITGCSNTDSLVVTESADRPENRLSEGEFELTCSMGVVQLQGAPTTDPSLVYDWTAPAGNPEQSSTTANLLASVPGEYALEITDPENNCTSLSRVTVTIDTAAFQGDFSPQNLLDCINEDADLVVQADDPGVTVVTLFQGPTGNFIPATTNSIVVSNPGLYTAIIINTDNGCVDTLQTNLFESVTPPVADAGPSATLNCFTTNRSLDGSGSSMGDSISFSWATTTGAFMGPTDIPSPPINSSGRYLLTVTNTNNNCTATDSVDIIADFVEPDLELARTQVIDCRETLRVLSPVGDAVAGWTFTWTTIGGVLPAVTDEINLTITEPGDYILTTTDPSNGCSAPDTVSIIQDVLTPVATVAEPLRLDCATTEVSLDGSGSTVERMAVFTWTTPDGNFLMGTDAAETSADEAGTYQLRIEYPDNGCVDSTSVTVAIDTLRPMASLLANENLDCSVTTATLLVDPAGMDPDFSYGWTLDGGDVTGPADAPTLLAQAPGNYQLTITNGRNQCAQILERMVTQDTLSPVISIAPPAELSCLMDQTDITATILSSRTDLDFSWSTTDGAIEGATTTESIAANTAGTYALRVVDPTNRCEVTQQVAVMEDREAPILSLPATLDLGCDPMPAPVEVTASGQSLSFAWMTTDGAILGATDTAEITADGPGRYSVEVTNGENGCTETAAILLTENTIDDFAVILEPTNCNRPTGTIIFGQVDGGVGPFLYSVDDGQNFSPGTTFRDVEPGNYALRVQDSRGCEVADTLSITQPEQVLLDLSDAETIVIGDSIRLGVEINYSNAPIDTFFWSPVSTLSCTDCLEPFARPFSSTIYEFFVVAEDGCTGRSTVAITVDERLDVFFPNVFSPNNDGVNDRYHPFADPSKIESISNFQIFDRWGNMVYRLDEVIPNDPNLGWDGTLRSREMNPGVFVYSALVRFIGGFELQYEGEFILMR